MFKETTQSKRIKPKKGEIKEGSNKGDLEGAKTNRTDLIKQK